MNQIQSQNIKVGAVVILYNPGVTILDNISSYIDQVSKLFIVDNSEHANPSIEVYFKSVNKVEYIYNNENRGVAYALNLGAEKAIQNHFDYLLTIDQDSKAPSGMIISLLNSISSKKNVGIVSPLHSNIFSTHYLGIQDNMEELQTVMTSGNLLSLKAFRNVGKFNEEYFIDYVDIEYCLRLKRYNYSIYRVNNIILEHNEGELSEKRFFKWKFYPINNPPIRLYYKTRNLLYLITKYREAEPEQIKREINVFIRNFIKLVFFEKDKLEKIKMILTGYFDYKKNKIGKLSH